MKKKEIILWVCVAIALAANLCIQRRPKYSWERDLGQRLATDFTLTRDEVKDYLLENNPDITDAQIDEWTAAGKLESMTIGRRTMYFHSSGQNLFRMFPDLRTVKSSNTGGGHEDIDANSIAIIKDSVTKNIAEGKESPYIALPKRMRVTFSLTVPANTLRPGKTLRCWLPYPRHDIARQTDVKFIEAGIDSTTLAKDEIKFSDPSCAHSSLYMESKVKRGKPTTFYEVFEYTSSGEWHPIDSSKVTPFDKTTASYKENTSEVEPHILFTPKIKAVADSLTNGIENPYSQAKAIYTWIDKTFPWASAREYSTIANIPEYVLEAGHGDCGQVTLLFMTMCRYKGIPTRWQSGLMMHPGYKNLHDWCEAYFEGVGWVPVDQSFGLTSYGGDFFLGGIEPYRLIVNEGLGKDLDPVKKFPRSDTVDFQRGEVEWDYGNLFFSQWDYSFKIEYLN